MPGTVLSMQNILLGQRKVMQIRQRAHCTEIDFALSFGAVLVKMIDLSKTESRDFFGIILDQENSRKLHLLPKSC